MSNYVATDTDLAAVADAIRTAGGTSSPLQFPQDFVDAIGNLGGGAELDALIDGTLTSISNSSATLVSPYRFSSMEYLQSVSFTNVETVKRSAFSGCTALTSIYFPKLKSLSGGNEFENIRVPIIVLPSYIGGTTASYAFRNNPALQAIDLYSPNEIGLQWFANDTALNTIILRNESSVVALAGVNAFTNNTRFASGGAGGTIYIKRALYDHLGDGTALDYKAATNWSTINGYGTITWAQIEGSIYETQYADGTPIA